MSTNSSITIKTTDSKFRTIYCHFDGYLAGVGKTLVEHYSTQESRTDFLISAGIRKNSPTGNIHPDGLTKRLVKARKESGVKFSDNPPTFHEIRSLAGRLYKNERGEKFAQKLLVHTSENTTKLYLNGRDDRAYVML